MALTPLLSAKPPQAPSSWRPSPATESKLLSGGCSQSNPLLCLRVLHLPSPGSLQPRRASPLSIRCQAKGFGSGAKVAPPKAKAPTAKRAESQLLKELGPRDEQEVEDPCPCGDTTGEGEKRRRSYKECCGRYHGGVKEPDASSLLRARYAAFAKGVIPYLVRTTHPQNGDLLAGGSEKLTADCKETCQRLAFKRLEIGEVEEQPEEAGEAFISFRVVYAYKHGTTTENQLLVERSRFVKEGDRWLYREKMPADDAVSDALWRHGPDLGLDLDKKSALPKGVFGRAQPKLRPRSS